MDAISFAKKINLPDEAVNTVEQILKNIGGNSEFKTLLENVKNTASADEIYEKSNAFAKKHGFNEFQFALALICACADIMKSFFDEKNYSEDLFISSAMDFKFKANECRDVYGFYGNFVLRWSVRVIRGEILRFGRLEFEETHYDGEDFYAGENVLHKGDRVLSVHIPTDGPLLMEQVRDSLKQAYEFYTESRDEVLFVMCSSWLLYPPFVKLFKEGGNMRAFAELFRPVSTRETQTFESGWRVFGTRDLSDVDSLPQNTTLRRNMAQYLKNGGSVGAGMGVIPIFPECDIFKGDNV